MVLAVFLVVFMVFLLVLAVFLVDFLMVFVMEFSCFPGYECFLDFFQMAFRRKNPQKPGF